MSRVPLASDGTFSMAFFTDFTTRGYVGLLDRYTVSVALFAAVALPAHGATCLTLKTQGAVHNRGARYSRVLWASAAPLMLASWLAIARSSKRTTRASFRESSQFSHPPFLVHTARQIL